MFRGKFMALAVAVVLLWLGAVFLLHIAAFLLRAMLLLAAILFIAHFFSKWRETSRRR